MTIENLCDNLLTSEVGTAANLKTHLHIINFLGFRVLSYFNQPLVLEKAVTEEQEVCCYLFPCVEFFCPSFNGPTSRLIDVYLKCQEICLSQFKDIPADFIEYHPVSIRCQRK